MIVLAALLVLAVPVAVVAQEPAAPHAVAEHAAAQESAAHQDHGAAAVSSSARVVVAHEEDDTRVRIHAGPFHLPAMHDAGAMQIVRGRVELPVSGWYHAFRVRVIDGSGAELPSELIHHVNLVMPERRDLFTPGLYRLAAAGAETDPIELPWPLAIGLEAGEPLLVIAMLHNAAHEPVHGATVELELDYRPFGRLPHVGVETLYLDVIEHGDRHSYDLPPGRSEMSWEGSPAVPGRVLALGGHLHRYGERIRFEDVTTGDVLWEGEPEIAASGDVASMPRGQFLLRLGLPLDPTHRYRVTAYYDNPTGAVIPDGAMGTLAGVFRPSRSAEWPPADTADAFYRRDLRAVLGEGGGGGVGE